ncbi:MAG: hypothetical protein M1157_08820, partial [Deinococcus sp.]|nr:hypothetical protein [Deinococcus sp.]
MGTRIIGSSAFGASAGFGSSTTGFAGVATGAGEGAAVLGEATALLPPGLGSTVNGLIPVIKKTPPATTRPNSRKISASS